MINIESLIRKIEEEFLATGTPTVSDGLTPSSPMTDTSILGEIPTGDEGYMSKNNNYLIPTDRKNMVTRRIDQLKKKKKMLEQESNYERKLIKKIEEAFNNLKTGEITIPEFYNQILKDKEEIFGEIIKSRSKK